MKKIKTFISFVLSVFMVIGTVTFPKAESLNLLVIAFDTTELYEETQYEVISENNKEIVFEKIFTNGDIRYDVYSSEEVWIGAVIKKVDENLVTIYEPDKKKIEIPLLSLESVKSQSDLINDNNIVPFADWVYSGFSSSYFTSAVHASSIGLLASTIAGAFGIFYGLAVSIVSLAIETNMSVIYLEKRYRTKIKIGGTTIIEEGWINSYRNSNYTNLYNTEHYSKVINP